MRLTGDAAPEGITIYGSIVRSNISVVIAEKAAKDIEIKFYTIHCVSNNKTDFQI